MACYHDLPWVEHACQHCAEPTPKNSTNTCPHCLKKAPIIQKMVCATWFRFPVKQIIYQFKFNQSLSNAYLLSSLLTATIQEKYKEDTLPNIIIPAPLSKNSLKKRGYNQSAMIGKQVSALLNIPMDAHLIRKVRETRAQHQLNQKERMFNLKNAFTIEPHTWTHVALIDDVITTNSTMLTLAKLLKKSGVKRIDAWSFAKTPKKKTFIP